MGTATLIYCVLLVCPLYASTAATAGKTDRENDGLIGPVQVVREETASISQKDGKPVEGPRTLRSITVYDAAGHLTKVLPPDRRLTAKTYDTKGNLTEELVYRSDGAQCWKHVYTYDERGHKTTYTEYDLVDGREWPAERHVYKYDDKGDLIEDGSYYGDGSLKEKSSYTHVYTPDGKKTEETRYREDLLSGTITCLYDRNGNLVEKTWFDDKGILSHREIWKYDGRGKLLERALYYEPNVLEEKSEYRYDDRGNLIEDAKYGRGGSLESKFTYTYEFDSTGNSVKRNVSARIKEEENKYSEPSWVVYRTLAYFGDPNENRAKELQADLLAMESRAQETMHPKEEPRLRVEVRLYGDGNHTKELCFFDRTGVTLPRAVHYAIRCTSGSAGAATTLSGGIYDPTGRLVQDLSGKSTDGDGSYKGSCDFQADNEPGVWLFKVNCDKSGYPPASTSAPLHLYSGRGVSAYKMDFDKTSFREETVLENRHLIAVFGNARISNKVLLYLHQKDAGANYNFGRTNIGRFDYMYNRFDGLGEATSTQAAARTYSASLLRESEGLGASSVRINASLVHPVNEISHGAYKRMSIWEKKGPQGYERVWAYSPDRFEVADHAVGDVDNDGQNEIVWVTSGIRSPGPGRIYVVEYSSGAYNVAWESEDMLSYQPRVIIADVDGDGANEMVVTTGRKGEVCVFEHDQSGYRQAASVKHPAATFTLAVGDFDQDGENEIATACQDGVLYVYEYNGADYVNAAKYTGFPGGFTKDMDSGDIDGDGFPELLVSGGGSRFVIIDYSNGSFHTTYVSEVFLDRGVNSCALGDVDNDGNLEVIVGAGRLLVYEYVSPSAFLKTWSGPKSGAYDHFLNHMIDVEDGDSDGLNELLFVKPTAGNPSMWGSKSGGSPLTELWTYDLPRADLNDESGDHVHALDTDSDSLKTALAVEITLPSEEADWLEYRVHSMKVDPNIHVVFPILSGSLGSGKDDRFHLEKGADERIANLRANTWHDFSGDVSSYCMVYDNSSEADNVDGTVLAWVRFRESENVKFQDVGLWNDSNGNAASRIRYDLKKATPADSFTCLLVFTKGDKETIDRWMPGIKSGKVPEKSFAVSPES